MVDDDLKIGLAVDQFQGDRNLPLKNEEVVDEIVLGKEREPPVKIGTEEVVIRFFLEDVANAHKFGVRGEAVEIPLDISVVEGNPADNSADEVTLISHVEEGIGLFDHLAGLDGNSPCDAGGGGGHL